MSRWNKRIISGSGERLGVPRPYNFEQALLALIEKNGLNDLLQRYKEIAK